jgi:dethiobiotin synthetase
MPNRHALLAALPAPLWVLGTGIGVGKTHVAADLARSWAQAGPVTYRKPFQTGLVQPDHPEAEASRVAGPSITVERHVCLGEGRVLDLEAAARWCLRPSEGRLLLEGAGGPMEPLTPQRHFLAWATELKLPCVLVALGGPSSLSPTLLAAEALMLRGWRIEALLLNPGADGTRLEVAEATAAVLRGFLPLRVEVWTD